jgi:antitoxin Phd
MLLSEEDPAMPRKSATLAHAAQPALFDRVAARSSTELQNRFGEVLEELRAEGTIVIERHERPAAVLLSVDAYARLQAQQSAPSSLDQLTAEFDALVARLQTSDAAEGLARAFAAPPSALAAAAAPGIRGAAAEAERRTH